MFRSTFKLFHNVHERKAFANNLSTHVCSSAELHCFNLLNNASILIHDRTQGVKEEIARQIPVVFQIIDCIFMISEVQKHHYRSKFDDQAAPLCKQHGDWWCSPIEVFIKEPVFSPRLNRYSFSCIDTEGPLLSFSYKSSWENARSAIWSSLIRTYYFWYWVGPMSLIEIFVHPVPGTIILWSVQLLFQGIPLSLLQYLFFIENVSRERRFERMKWN